MLDPAARVERQPDFQPIVDDRVFEGIVVLSETVPKYQEALAAREIFAEPYRIQFRQPLPLGCGDVFLGCGCRRTSRRQAGILIQRNPDKLLERPPGLLPFGRNFWGPSRAHKQDGKGGAADEPSPAREGLPQTFVNLAKHTWTVRLDVTSRSSGRMVR